MAGKLASFGGGGISGVTRAGLGLATGDAVTFGTVTAGGATLTGLTDIGGTMSFSVTKDLTADSSDNQASALALTTTVNVIDSGGANDAVKLLTASRGLCQIVVNLTGQTIQVFPNSSDAIDGGSANAATTQATGTVAAFFAADDTDWYKLEA